MGTSFHSVGHDIKNQGLGRTIYSGGVVWDGPVYLKAIEYGLGSGTALNLIGSTK
jgi:hypothetical protein